MAQMAGSGGMGSVGLLHRAARTAQPDGAESGESPDRRSAVHCTGKDKNSAWAGSDIPATPTAFHFHFRAWAAGMERFLRPKWTLFDNGATPQNQTSDGYRQYDELHQTGR